MTDDISGITLLMAASAHGLDQLVLELLVQRGAEVDQQDSAGRTALMMATINRHEKVVVDLLQHGAEINRQRINGCTALMMAAHTGSRRIVHLLLQHGANANHQNARSGDTALMLATDYNHPTVVARLLRAGASLKLRNEQGETALQIAKRMGSDECIDVIRRHLTELAASRREVAASEPGAGEASAAAAATSFSLSEIVVSAGQDEESAILAWIDGGGGQVNVTFEVGGTSGRSTLLTQAVLKEQEKLVESLLQRGADINVRDGIGRTALMLAGQCSNEHVASSGCSSSFTRSGFGTTSRCSRGPCCPSRSQTRSRQPRGRARRQNRR